LLPYLSFCFKKKRSSLPETISRPYQIVLLRPRIFRPKQKRSAYETKFFGPNQNVLLCSDHQNVCAVNSILLTLLLYACRPIGEGSEVGSVPACYGTLQ
jgi:hypothetical protein